MYRKLKYLSHDPVFTWKKVVSGLSVASDIRLYTMSGFIEMFSATAQSLMAHTILLNLSINIFNSCFPPLFGMWKVVLVIGGYIPSPKNLVYFFYDKPAM